MDVFIDIIIIDGLMMAFIILLLILRDLTVMMMIASASIAFGAVYLYMKNEAKKRESLGKNFLDSQTILGDMEMAEQIGIEGYEYVILPESTIEGNEICYEKIDLDEVSQALASPYIRFGGESTLRPNVVDRLVETRLMELKEEAENRARERVERETEVETEEEEKLEKQDMKEFEKFRKLKADALKKKAQEDVPNVARKRSIKDKLFRRRRLRKIGDTKSDLKIPNVIEEEEEEEVTTGFASINLGDDE